MPGALTIAAGTENVEQDTAETKLSEMSLHKFLICFSRLEILFTAFTRRKTDGRRELAEDSRSRGFTAKFGPILSFAQVVIFLPVS